MSLLLLGVVVALAGCGGGTPTAKPTGSVSIPTKDSPFAFPTVSSSDLGTDPTITAHTRPPTDSMLEVLHQGSGPAIKAGDVLAVDLKAQVWQANGIELTPFEDTFSNGRLFVQAIDKVVTAWTKKLPGVLVGSRVLLIAPPQDAYGMHPPAGTSSIVPNDTLMFLIDVLGAFPRTAGPDGTALRSPDPKLPTVSGTTDPKITLPKGAVPTTLQQEVLVRGNGPKVADGSWIVAQYTGMVWDGARVFDSTWERKDGALPIAIHLAPPGERNGVRLSGAVPGLIKGLVGQTVGSRVLLVIPPDEGYGAAGNQAAGVTAKDTMVFVIDILGSYRGGPSPSAAPS
jgi:FKBP-type peptidyl-prolyl cis-trans isomerase